MFTRRQLLGGTVLAGLGSHLTRRAVAAELKAAADSKGCDLQFEDLSHFCSYVDPFHRHGRPRPHLSGATVPFGMVQLSPDTDVARWDAVRLCYTTTRPILGFSHTHLSGTGASVT